MPSTSSPTGDFKDIALYAHDDDTKIADVTASDSLENNSNLINGVMDIIRDVMAGKTPQPFNTGLRHYNWNPKGTLNLTNGIGHPDTISIKFKNGQKPCTKQECLIVTSLTSKKTKSHRPKNQTNIPA